MIHIHNPAYDTTARLRAAPGDFLSRAQRHRLRRVLCPEWSRVYWSFEPRRCGCDLYSRGVHVQPDGSHIRLDVDHYDDEGKPVLAVTEAWT